MRRVQPNATAYLLDSLVEKVYLVGNIKAANFCVLFFTQYLFVTCFVNIRQDSVVTLVLV